MYKGILIPQVICAKTCVRYQGQSSGDCKGEIHFWSRDLKQINTLSCPSK